MLLGGPVAGALLGMAGGGALGARDTGLDDGRLRALGAALAPGDAVVCALADAADARAVRAVFRRYGELVAP